MKVMMKCRAVVGNRDKVFITESPVKIWQKLGNFN